MTAGTRRLFPTVRIHSPSPHASPCIRGKFFAENFHAQYARSSRSSVTPTRRTAPCAATPVRLSIFAQKRTLAAVSAPLARQRAGAAGGGGCRAGAAPDKRGRNAPRNRGSRGSPFPRRNGSPARPDGPAAICRSSRSDRAGSSSPPFQGWAWRAPGGAAARVGSAAAVRPDPGAGSRPVRRR
jgi:hypothetical protein